MASGAITPHSTLPLPTPIGAVGHLPYGIIAIAVVPPSLPQRFILSRVKVSPTPLNEVSAPVLRVWWRWIFWALKFTSRSAQLVRPALKVGLNSTQLVLSVSGVVVLSNV